MKKFAKIFCGLVATACLSASAFAAAPASQPATNGGAAMGGQGGDDHPCKEIAEACKAAGFSKGAAASGKGIGKDCIQPLLAGSKVAGVSVSPQEIAACKAKMAARGNK